MPRKLCPLVMEKSKKKVKSLPSSDNGRGVLCRTVSEREFVISHNSVKEKLAFSLWEQTESGYEKIATGDSPDNLYPLIPWKE